MPADYFLRSRMVIRGGTGLGFLSESALAEYVRCYTLKTITGSCRDYRATATCDFEMDTADKDKKLAMPLLLLWGARGHPPERAREFLDIWNQYAANVARSRRCPAGTTCRKRCPTRSTITTRSSSCPDTPARSISCAAPLLSRALGELFHVVRGCVQHVPVDLLESFHITVRAARGECLPRGCSHFG